MIMPARFYQNKYFMAIADRKVNIISINQENLRNMILSAAPIYVVAVLKQTVVDETVYITLWQIYLGQHIPTFVRIGQEEEVRRYDNILMFFWFTLYNLVYFVD